MRTNFRGWWLSAFFHGLLLLAVIRLGHAPPRDAPWIPVELAAPEAPATSPPEAPPDPASPPEVAAPEPRTRPAPRVPLAAPPPVVPPTNEQDPVLIPPTWEAFDRSGAEWWRERSLARWIEECRDGTSQPDSILERAPTVEERGRATMVASLNREFHLRRWEWTLEKFHEEYARNFPLMR